MTRPTRRHPADYPGGLGLAGHNLTPAVEPLDAPVLDGQLSLLDVEPAPTVEHVVAWRCACGLEVPASAAMPSHANGDPWCQRALTQLTRTDANPGAPLT